MTIPRHALRHNANYLWLTLITLLLDQYTKHWVEQTIPLFGVIEVMPHLNWVHRTNTGAAFSMLSNAPPMAFVALAAVVCAGIVAWLRQHHYDERVTAAGLCLIMGGAVGNVIDRLRQGHVTDFIDFYASWVPMSGGHFASFNVADIAISIGAGLLVLDMFLQWRKPKT